MVKEVGFFLVYYYYFFFLKKEVVPRPSYSRPKWSQEAHLHLHSQSDWLLTFSLSNLGRSLVRKPVRNGKERHFLKVFQRYCVCRMGQTDGWINGQTQGRHDNTASKDSYGSAVKLFESFCWWQQRQRNCIKAREQSELRIYSTGCKNANLKQANGLNVILKVADNSLVQFKNKK